MAGGCHRRGAAVAVALAVLVSCVSCTVLQARVTTPSTKSQTQLQREALESQLSQSSERVRLSSDDASILYLPPTDYDNRRPPPGGTTKVKISIILTKLYGVNENDGTVRITMETAMMWKDRRLKYDSSVGALKPGEKFITLNEDEVWVPHIDYHGAIIVTAQHSQARVFPDGTVYFLKVSDYLMAVELDLRWFPFDSQSLIIEGTLWDHPATNVELITSTDWEPWNSERRSTSFMVSASMDTEKTHYILQGFDGELIVTSSVTADSSVKWSGVRLVMSTYRKQIYYVLAYFIPLNIITAAASTSFYIDHHDSGSRISISLSAILALIGMDYVMLAELPKCGYVLWIHFYVIGLFLLLLLPLLFHFVVIHFQYFDPTIGADMDTGNEGAAKDKGLAEQEGGEKGGEHKEAQRGPLNRGFRTLIKFGSMFFPSGWGVPAVRRVDNCGFLLFVVCFFVFNIGMFLLGILNEIHADISNHLAVVAQPDP